MRSALSLSALPFRRPLVGAVAAALLALLAWAPAASARLIEIGSTMAEATPSCPGSPCFAVSRTTGFQAKVGPQRGLYVAPEDGKIVAWSIKLGKPGPRQTSFFEDTLGGPASAGITVLRPGRKLYHRVTGKSQIQRLEPFFGTTVQFPLGRSLNVRKGYVIALTVPTWAPALAVGFGNDTSWRASRPRTSCDETGRQTAQLRLRDLSRYECLYRTARLTYSATLITTPKPPEPAPPGR
jgi:hypothetical protein